MRTVTKGGRLVGRCVMAAALLAGLAAGAYADAGGDRALRYGNYLIITAPQYYNSAPLNEFVAAKQSMGFSVTVHEVTSGTSNTAIRTYIQNLWITPNAPRYVLLVGDTSGSTSTATTIPHHTGGATKHCATDLPYGCMDGGDDWYPDIFVGRFSVTSVSMLQDVVDKTLFVEAGNFSDPEYVKRGVFLANPSTQGMAEPTHDWIIENYLEPDGYTGIKLYASEGAGTADVTNAINNGALWFGYYGHSGSTGWWDPSFSQSNVQSLSNDGLYGVGWSFSCNVGNFSLGECFAETWLREANKGAAAVIMPTDYIYWGSVEAWEPSTVLETSFFRAFFKDDIWEVGPAWQAGLYHFLNDFDGSTDIKRNFFELYNLLGDPALLLPRLDGFSMSSDPGSQDLCSPPDDEAVYTIDVSRLGEYAESVHLGLAGAPAGTTVAFSVNDAPPPFTSVLTVSGIDGSHAGDHDLVLTGSATSMDRMLNLGLAIVGGVPGEIPLISPLDGATGVPLSPVLEWDAVVGAYSYDIEIATDAAFTNVVYSATADAASHMVDTPLEMLATYYWHVRATNACGEGPYSAPFDFTTVNQVMPESYDMLNGETGSYSYFDDTYDGDGDNSQELAPLSNGLGDLTDGIRATENWNDNNEPYVGWHTIDPTITFHFDASVNVEVVVLNFDDANGGGGVYPPPTVTIVMGGTSLTLPVDNPSDGAPFDMVFEELGLSGESLELTLNDTGSDGHYVMLAEAEFFGGPNVGACCVEGDCTITTEDLCLGQSGVYQGDGTGCDPNPCALPEPACLIISEVVQGAESGACPLWIEITNTGLADFTFDAGGVIVQLDGDTDLQVDVDMTGVTILAGQSFVINSNNMNMCTGAFPVIYQIEADLYTNTAFGDGDDRYILTDTVGGTNLLDIYGEFGVDGTGEVWEYGNGFAYRLPAYNVGNNGNFAPGEWYFSGKDALVGANPTQMLLDNTFPATHAYDEPCTGRVGDLDGDNDVDFDDLNILLAAYNSGPGGDLDGDGDTDFDDLNLLLANYEG